MLQKRLERIRTAVRSLACKWIRVLWRCWQDRTVYEEAEYLAAVRKAGSPILAWMEKNPAIIRARRDQTLQMN